jgi:hypothetical protein
VRNVGEIFNLALSGNQTRLAFRSLERVSGTSEVENLAYFRAPRPQNKKRGSPFDVPRFVPPSLT